MEKVNIVSRNKAHDLAVQTMYAFLMLEKCNQLISFESLIELVFNQEYKVTSPGMQAPAWPTWTPTRPTYWTSASTPPSAWPRRASPA